MQIQFYHLLTTSLETALPKLIANAHEADYRIGIKTKDESHNKRISEALWGHDVNSFLPHGDSKSPHPETQPIFLSSHLGDWPNKPNLLVITDGTLFDAENAPFERILDMFDGGDENQVSQARKRWKQYKDQNHDISYIKQQPNGSWKKEA